jgi:magnesium transporter
MHTPVVFIHPEEDQEVVARELAIYDFYAMPIVDHDGRMLGIVTFDDVVDVVEDEAVEDQELFGGMAPSEEDYVDQTFWQAIKQRFPWLALFLVLSSGSGFIITWFGNKGYSGEKPFFIYVFALLPMIAAMAGNAATQTATLVIRAISIRDVTTSNALEVVGRELRLGFVMGLLLGALAFVRAVITSHEYALSLGAAVTASVVAVMGVATVTGAALPMFFKRLGFDPAVMSSPLIATVIDIVTITLYLSVSVLVYVSFIAPHLA